MDDPNATPNPSTPPDPTIRMDTPEVPPASATWQPSGAPGYEPSSPPTYAPPSVAPASPSVAPVTPPAGYVAPVAVPAAPSWAPPKQRDDGGRWAGVIAGLILLGIGLWFFADRTLGLDMPDIRWSQMWPLILVLVGVIILVGALRRERR